MLEKARDITLSMLSCMFVLIAWAAFLAFDIAVFYFMYMLLTGRLF